MSNKLLPALACCLLAASACNIIYKQNIQQGNAIEQDKLNQLKLGMTMNQVAFLLGTPSIRDPFHHNRWDYMSSFSRRGGDPLTRLVTLRFENAILKEMTGIDPDAPDETQSKQDLGKEDVEKESPSAPAVEEEIPEEPIITAIDTPIAEDSELTDAREETPTPEVEQPLIADSDVSANEVIAEDVPEEIADAIEPDTTEDLVEEITQEVETAPENPQAWIIQLGAFKAIDNAQKLVTMLADAGFDGLISNRQLAGLGTRYLVRTEGFDTRGEAQQQLESINSALALEGFLVPATDWFSKKGAKYK